MDTGHPRIVDALGAGRQGATGCATGADSSASVCSVGGTGDATTKIVSLPRRHGLARARSRFTPPAIDLFVWGAQRPVVAGPRQATARWANTAPWVASHRCCTGRT